MSGELCIDGQDVYTGYGVFFCKDGFNELLALAPLKEVAGNDWPEEDGREVDLSHPVLNAREVSLRFAAHRALRVGEFLEMLSDGAYHTFEMPLLGRSFRLRLASQQSLDVAPGLETFTLKFCDDFPWPEGYTYLPPAGGIAVPTGYELDSRSLAQYGVSVLAGGDAEIRKSPAVKTNLLQTSATRHGAVYDGAEVRFQTKEVQLSCLMQAPTATVFWRNYDALRYDLLRPGERTLYADCTGYEYPCYYKSCKVSEFRAADRIWCRFDLTLVFTAFRVYGDEYLLASESGEWIVSEDGEYAIDLEQ